MKINNRLIDYASLNKLIAELSKKNKREII